MDRKYLKLNLDQNKIPTRDINNKLQEALGKKKKREFKQSKKLRRYLTKIDKILPMSPEKENNLWAKIKEGDKKSEESIFKANLRLVVSVAKKYRDNPYLTFWEFISEGERGLRIAIDRFKWHWEEKEFLPYATWIIRQAIGDALRYERRQILNEGDMEIFVWRNKRGKITDITFSGETAGGRMLGSGKFEGTKEEKQKYGNKIIEKRKKLIKAEEEAQRKIRKASRSRCL